MNPLQPETEPQPRSARMLELAAGLRPLIAQHGASHFKDAARIALLLESADSLDKRRLRELELNVRVARSTSLARLLLDVQDLHDAYDAKAIDRATSLVRDSLDAGNGDLFAGTLPLRIADLIHTYGYTDFAEAIRLHRAQL